MLERPWPPTESQLLAAFQRLGYPLFGGDASRPRPYDLNLFGIRRQTAERVGTYDDILGVTYVTEGGRRSTLYFPGTTDPGLPALQKPKNPAGVAVMKEGFYRGLWRMGLHKGKSPALVQVGPVVVYRDNDKDSQVDAKKGVQKEQRGLFGINMHRSSQASEDSNVVGLWSEGCQVFRRDEDLERLLSLCREQVRRGWGGTFSYALFTEREVLQ